MNAQSVLLALIIFTCTLAFSAKVSCNPGGDECISRRDDPATCGSYCAFDSDEGDMFCSAGMHLLCFPLDPLVLSCVFPFHHAPYLRLVSRE